MGNSARRAYSAEQLLALRRSASDEPALTIQNKAEESAIKDHVVRGARSFGARSSNSLLPPRTLPPPVDPRFLGVSVLGEIDPNNQKVRGGSSYKTSPTPSFTKKRAEEILKSHGSPPGLRVTAGGRIVPSEQSPLCSPRYGYSAINKNGGLIKFAPGYPPPRTFQHFAKSLPNGFVAQDPSGRLCQMVDGRFLPVHEVNGIPQLYITAPNLNNVSSGKNGSLATASDDRYGFQTLNGHIRPPTVQAPSGPTISAQIVALEKQYTKLEAERRGLDKAEVLQRSEMNGKAYTQLIQKRRELVNHQDELRRSIKALQAAKSTVEAPIAPVQTTTYSSEGLTDAPKGSLYPSIPQVPFFGPEGEAITMDPQHGVMPFPGMPLPGNFNMYMPPPFYAGPMQPVPPYFSPNGMMPGGFQSHGDFPGTGNAFGPQFQPTPSPEFGSVPQPAMKADRSDEETDFNPSMRLESETDGSDESKKTSRGHKSSLNPMSAVYEPASSKLTTPQKQSSTTKESALTEAIRKHNDWAGASADVSTPGGPSNENGKIHHSSGSSYATADFFPQNPRDHSMNKQAYAVSRKSDAEIAAETVPAQLPSSDEAQISPEKERHNPNWNPTIPDLAFKSVQSSSSGEGTANLQSHDNVQGSIADPVADRTNLNISPKSRPDFLVMHRTETECAVRGSPVPLSPGPVPGRSGVESGANLLAGLAQHSEEYVDGFRAGLARAPISPDKGKAFLDGYCAGLQRSAALNESMTQSISSKTTAVNDENKVSPASSVAKRIERRSSLAPRPPLELRTESLDTMKQAMFGPSNENALLSPNEEAPHVNNVAGKGFGAWSRSREPSLGVDSVLSQLRNGQVSFPERTSSMVGRQLSSPDTGNTEHVTAAAIVEKQVSNEYVVGTDQSGMVARRDFSAQTQPAQSSYLHRAYSGHRVLSSPALEWKSGSSIAQVAGLATGYFAQYDGTTAKAVPTEMEATQIPCPTNPKFKEASMPSDEPPLSAPTSPQGSPGKKSSPAKARFAQIAGKAGIKVGAQRRDLMEQEPEQMSPQERRKWRDLWKKRHTATIE